MTEKATTIVKQVGSKMTSFGFPNTPHGAEAKLSNTLTDSIEVWSIIHLTKSPEPVFALVINKGHAPLPAWHVVDFRVGGDIYS